MSSRRSRNEGQAQPDHVQAVVQIFAEQAVAHALFQVLVGGGDHAHVRLDRLVPADAVEVAIGQHAQQACLQVERHVADLVEEQGAVLGLLEAAAPHRLGAGEGAALVAEQLGFQQVLRDRRRVQGDERLLSARAVFMEGARDQLLAGAAFPGNQDRHVRLRQAADGAEYFLHRRGLAQDLGRL
jgi:hypothetical protein